MQKNYELTCVLQIHAFYIPYRYFAKGEVTWPVSRMHFRSSSALLASLMRLLMLDFGQVFLRWLRSFPCLQNLAFRGSFPMLSHCKHVALSHGQSTDPAFIPRMRQAFQRMRSLSQTRKSFSLIPVLFLSPEYACRERAIPESAMQEMPRPNRMQNAYRRPRLGLGFQLSPWASQWTLVVAGVVVLMCLFLWKPALEASHTLSREPSRRLRHTTLSAEHNDPVKWLRENNDEECIVSGDPCPTPRYPRPRAALMTLVRNEELEGIMQSMRQLEFRWNHRYRYPWIFFNEVPFTEEFKVSLPSLCSTSLYLLEKYNLPTGSSCNCLCCSVSRGLC